MCEIQQPSSPIGIKKFFKIALDLGTRVNQGVKLPTERELASKTGISRASVREYLAALKVLGLVEKIQGSANIAKVNLASNSLIFDLMVHCGQLNLQAIDDAREMYEIGMISLVSQIITDQQVESLNFIVNQMVFASLEEDYETACVADLAFHNALIDILNNPLISKSFSEIQLALRKTLMRRRMKAIAKEQEASTMWQEFGYRTDVVHYEIIHALAAHDAQKATEAMKRHFDQWRNITNL